MGGPSLSPQEFEQHLKELQQRLTDYLERGVGKFERLRAEAQKVLSLAREFPDVFERYQHVEGLVAEMLAREKQKEFMATQPPDEAPGCLLGWVLRRK